MNSKPNGELVPIGGGDSIPLIREQMTLGRRDSCDVCLRFPNISGLHAELVFRAGVWYVRDLGSTNGTKVNEVKVQQKALRPGDKVSFAKRTYAIRYQMTGKPEDLEDDTQGPQQKSEDMWGQSLLERAGLSKPKRDTDDRPGARPGRINRPLNADDIQIRRPDESDDEDE